MMSETYEERVRRIKIQNKERSKRQKEVEADRLKALKDNALVVTRASTRLEDMTPAERMATLEAKRPTPPKVVAPPNRRRVPPKQRNPQSLPTKESFDKPDKELYFTNIVPLEVALKGNDAEQSYDSYDDLRSITRTIENLEIVRERPVSAYSMLSTDDNIRNGSSPRELESSYENFGRRMLEAENMSLPSSSPSSLYPFYNVNDSVPGDGDYYAPTHAMTPTLGATPKLEFLPHMDFNVPPPPLGCMPKTSSDHTDRLQKRAPSPSYGNTACAYEPVPTGVAQHHPYDYHPSSEPGHSAQFVSEMTKQDARSVQMGHTFGKMDSKEPTININGIPKSQALLVVKALADINPALLDGISFRNEDSPAVRPILGRGDYDQRDTNGMGQPLEPNYGRTYGYTMHSDSVREAPQEAYVANRKSHHEQYNNWEDSFTSEVAAPRSNPTAQYDNHFLQTQKRTFESEVAAPRSNPSAQYDNNFLHAQKRTDVFNESQNNMWGPVSPQPQPARPAPYRDVPDMKPHYSLGEIPNTHSFKDVQNNYGSHPKYYAMTPNGNVQEPTRSASTGSVESCTKIDTIKSEAPDTKPYFDCQWGQPIADWSLSTDPFRSIEDTKNSAELKLAKETYSPPKPLPSLQNQWGPPNCDWSSPNEDPYRSMDDSKTSKELLSAKAAQTGPPPLVPPKKKMSLHERMEAARNDTTKRFSRSHQMKDMKLGPIHLTYNGQPVELVSNPNAPDARQAAP